METPATLHGVRLSAQKGRLVADQIRGLPVEKALNLLAFSPKKGAKIIKKVLESAIANAEHNDGADVDELKVKKIFVERGTPAALHARAKGRGNVTKHTCHVFITVGDGKEIGYSMGQKIHPIGFRLSVNRNWASRWYANSKNFATMLNEDLKVRDYLKKQLVARLGRQSDHRAAGEGCAHHHPQRAAGRGDRQEGRGHRVLHADLRKLMGVRGARQYRGDPQAGGRRATDRRLDRAAAGEAHHVPPRHEACDAERDAAGCAGHQDHERGPPERHRDCAHRMVPRRPCSASYAACRYRLRLCRGEDHLRGDRHQGLGIQGRGDAPTASRRRRPHRRRKRPSACARVQE